MEEMEEFKLSKQALEKMKNCDTVMQMIKEGKTFQDILEYSNDKMAKFYEAASSLFDRQEYRKSGDAFGFLTTLNPYVHAYWMGLGMSEQLDGMYEDALLAYAMAVLTDFENPIPHYHSATCYRELGEKDNAIDSLTVAIQFAEKKEEYQSLKEQAVAVKARWEAAK